MTELSFLWGVMMTDSCQIGEELCDDNPYAAGEKLYW